MTNDNLIVTQDPENSVLTPESPKKNPTIVTLVESRFIVSHPLHCPSIDGVHVNFSLIPTRAGFMSVQPLQVTLGPTLRRLSHFV